MTDLFEKDYKDISLNGFLLKEDEKLNPLGRWLKLCRSCDCGSYESFDYWFKDEHGKPLFKVCSKCEERKIKAHKEKENKDV